jgi:hypothetical protein
MVRLLQREIASGRQASSSSAPFCVRFGYFPLVDRRLAVVAFFFPVGLLAADLPRDLAAVLFFPKALSQLEAYFLVAPLRVTVTLLSSDTPRNKSDRPRRAETGLP